MSNFVDSILKQAGRFEKLAMDQIPYVWPGSNRLKEEEATEAARMADIANTALQNSQKAEYVRNIAVPDFENWEDDSEIPIHLDLDDERLQSSDVVGYLDILLGDFEEGVQDIKKLMSSRSQDDFYGLRKTIQVLNETFIELEQRVLVGGYIKSNKLPQKK